MTRQVLVSLLLLATVVGIALAQQSGSIGEIRGRVTSGGELAVNIGGGDGVTLNAGRIPVLADVNNPSATDASNRAKVVGCVENDADASDCFPLYIGGKASMAAPTAVSADNDNVAWRMTTGGAGHVVSRAHTATLANVNDTATSTALISANTARLHAKCFNDSTAVLYINYGATASATAFTEKVEPGGSWFMEWPIYVGVVNGIWASDASGAARCTELTQ